MSGEQREFRVIFTEEDKVELIYVSVRDERGASILSSTVGDEAAIELLRILFRSALEQWRKENQAFKS